MIYISLQTPLVCLLASLLSECELRAKSLEEWKSGLEALHAKVLSDIRTHLFQNAKLANAPRSLVIDRASKPQKFVINEEVPIIELSGPDFLELAGPGFRRGLYHPGCGKIFLNRDTWCLKTLYHETLHSVSVFSCRVDLKPRTEKFAEGLTEFLTGLLLWKAHPYCYENCWRKESRKECHYTYAPFTNYWCAFFRRVHVQQITDVFFWNDNSSWETIFGEFIGRIQMMGHPGFTNILLTKSPFHLAILFHDECVTNFGAEYEDACECDPDIDKILL
jgi:hypothetical protein